MTLMESMPCQFSGETIIATGSVVQTVQPVPHPTRSKPQTDKPMTPAISFFKTLVRVARMTPGYPTPDSFKLAVQQALAIVPWLPAHYREVRGTDLGPNLYGTRVAKLSRYANGEGLSPRKRAEIGLARVLLADGRVVGPEELATRLRSAAEAEREAAKAYQQAMAAEPEEVRFGAEDEAAAAREGELRIVLV